MTATQKFFTTILPRRWAEAMQAESRSWQIRCQTCGREQSYRDAGGIRFKAASTRKIIGGWCPQCRARRCFEMFRQSA